MTSACIKWAKEQLDGFNALLARQLYSVERGTSVWEKCMGIVLGHADMLAEVGVDFGDLVGKDLIVANGVEGGGQGNGHREGNRYDEVPLAD